MKKILFTILYSFTLLYFYTFVAHAQTSDDSQCVGRGLADYMNAVIAGAGKIPNVKLLSPAFNMTSATFDSIVNSMGENGAKFGDLDGIAGNVYNVENRRITSWLTEKLANPYISGKPVFITETGEKDFADGKINLDEAKIRLRPELDALRTVGNQWHVQAALLFNGLGANSGFSTFQWSNDGLKDLCGNQSCGPVGINQATLFSQSDERYSIMRNLGMLYDLEIANAGNTEAVLRAINALPGGYVIVRIGVGDDSGGFADPQKYVEFIKTVASQTSNTVYFIAGPNEPDSEYWATPSCKITQLKSKKGPLEEGFIPTALDCNATKEPNYHPLRPYPGNPCDPLIARSVPEAPNSPEKKFNTFACGSSLTPQREEVFDPYGKNGLYEGLEREGYAHTVCEPSETSPEFAAIAKSGGTVTCWRTSAFDITVDLSHANVGILGNTQDNTLTDAQKVNEYLSWYLTGTPQIGDQLPLNPKNPNDIDRVVNYSGPIRKLLPFDLQNIVKKTIVESVDKKEIHNYIVGCKKDVDLTYVLDALKAWLDTSLTNAGLVWWAALNLTPRLPFDIYDFVTKYTEATIQLTSVLKNFTPGDTPKILAILTPLGDTALGEDLGKLGEKSAESLKKLSNLINTLNLDMAESCQTSNDAKRLKEFADHLPPDPADPKYKDNFKKYWDDYIWWRGMINLPLIGPIDWINQDIWAKLFQNIPFSSMEDTTGEFTMSVFRDPSFDQQVDSLDSPQYSSVVNKNTAPLELYIKSAHTATK